MPVLIRVSQKMSQEKSRCESVDPPNLKEGGSTPTGTKATGVSLTLGEKFSWRDTVV